MKNYLIFAHAIRAISSVGSEHLVYTQRVGGSNPSSPTKHSDIKRNAFFLRQNLFICLIVFISFTVLLLANFILVTLPIYKKESFDIIREAKDLREKLVIVQLFTLNNSKYNPKLY